MGLQLPGNVLPVNKQDLAAILRRMMKHQQILRGQRAETRASNCRCGDTVSISTAPGTNGTNGGHKGELPAPVTELHLLNDD